ncbi:MAG TPA: YkgJ family cysteine cluster protein [Nitrospirae bacterium]|nr:YkgJ family cysteine cluster protein [Nitrospirota bacterium]
MTDLKDKLQIITPFTNQAPAERRKKIIVKQTECNKCGTCCIGASPMLLKDDYKLYLSNLLNDTNTYTVRLNEPLYNRREQDLYYSPIEVIKIDEDSGCIFYEGAGQCSIYENRPIQCKEFECWDNTPPMEGLEDRCLKRKDIFGGIDFLMDLIEKHEEFCSYDKFLNLIEKFHRNNEEALKDLIDILKFDISARDYVANSFGIKEKSINLIFGRPMTECLEFLGLHIRKEEETFVIRKIDNGTKVD